VDKKSVYQNSPNAPGTVTAWLQTAKPAHRPIEKDGPPKIQSIYGMLRRLIICSIRNTTMNLPGSGDRVTLTAEEGKRNAVWSAMVKKYAGTAQSIVESIRRLIPPQIKYRKPLKQDG
jgi:hypothetical protein